MLPLPLQKRFLALTDRVNQERYSVTQHKEEKKQQCDGD